jgi:transcriptional regulator with XRE-family HTH domain
MFILACRLCPVKAPSAGAMPERFGDKFRYLRQKQGLTQAQVADQLKLASGSHVSKVEGGVAPSISLVLRIAYLFGVTTDYLLRDSIPVENFETASTMFESSETPLLPHAFGIKLRALRLQRNLTQEVVTTQLGFARQAYISNLEAGRKLPGLDTVVRIADFFGVTTDYLLWDTFPVEQTT